jgi:RND family efflux transporter MFP subunit
MNRMENPIMFRNSMILKTLFIAATCVSILGGCGKERNNEAVEHPSEERDSKDVIVRLDRHKVLHAGIQVELVANRSVPIPVTLPGRVTFNETKVAHISARIGGRVEKVLAVTNDRVKTGTALMQLYSQEFLSIQFEFLQAVERLNRTGSTEGKDEKLSARSLYDAGRRKLAVLGLSDDELQELERSRTPEDFYTARAPFDGVILESKLRLGEFVQTGTEMFEIADLSTLWVLADVYEKDLPFAHTGAKATIEVSAYPTQWTGILTSVYNILDEKTRTVKVRIEVQNNTAQLKPGMFCTVKIQAQLGKETIKVPASALLGDTEKHFVFVSVDDSTFEKRDVRTGTETREFAEILDGLTIGEKIVIKGGFFLKSELAKETFGEEH